MAVPDQSSEPNRPAVHQWNAPAPAVHTEDRVLRGDAEIAPRRELEAAGDRVPFDRSDDRLGKQHARRPDRAVAVAVEATRPLHPRLSHRLQIGAGAEGAVRSAEDGDVERLVGFEAAERIGKRRSRRAVDRIGDFGPVDRDDRDGTLATKFDAHGVPSLSGSQSSRAPGVPSTGRSDIATFQRKQSEGTG